MSDTPPQPNEVRMVQISGNVDAQPIPTAVAIGHGMDGRYVLIGFKCAVGELNFFIPTHQIQDLIQALANNAATAKSRQNGGLIIPTVLDDEALRQLRGEQ